MVPPPKTTTTPTGPLVPTPRPSRSAPPSCCRGMQRGKLECKQQLADSFSFVYSAAVASLVQGAPDGVVAGVAAVNLNPTVAAAAEALRAVLARTPAVTAAEWAAELKQVASAQQLDARGTAQAAFDAMFTAQNVSLKDKVRSHADHLRPALASGGVDAQRAVLERLEMLVHERADLSKKLMALIKQVRDCI